ncbi:hypothetical protein EVAR_60781_1 [Eumeta japonica]|uniref:Uncharacterized protein n=1 Tax=Eumeta variegata TaxID=151549 RepID=A0A4C1ZP94_EUMVA|nr:hypothetical protein EVAR_60781_1 [Eumeta japonica]
MSHDKGLRLPVMKFCSLRLCMVRPPAAVRARGGQAAIIYLVACPGTARASLPARRPRRSPGGKRRVPAVLRSGKERNCYVIRARREIKRRRKRHKIVLACLSSDPSLQASRRRRWTASGPRVNRLINVGNWRTPKLLTASQTATKHVLGTPAGRIVTSVVIRLNLKAHVEFDRCEDRTPTIRFSGDGPDHRAVSSHPAGPHRTCPDTIFKAFERGKQRPQISTSSDLGTSLFVDFGCCKFGPSLICRQFSRPKTF